MKKMVFAGEEIHMDLQNGILVLTEDSSLECNGEMAVSVSNKSIIETESICAVLPNFTLKQIGNIPTQSIAWLNNNSERLKEGCMAYTIFQTCIFEVTKTSTMKIL